MIPDDPAEAYAPGIQPRYAPGIQPRYTWVQIARIIHDNNMAIEQVLDDPAPSSPWDAEPHEIQVRVRKMCLAAARLNGSPKFVHDYWVAMMTGAGWRLGPEKDWSLKTHPHLVPWSQLTPALRDKARCLVALVRVLTSPDQV